MHDFLLGNEVFQWIATWANPVCDALFRFASHLGDTPLYFVCLAPLFWVVDRRRAVVLFVLLVISSYLNTFLKLWFDMPRPDPGLVRTLAHENSNGFPSGHAQNALVFWGYLALWNGRAWARIAAAVIIAMIAFSRLYVGVHFPLDVLGGLTLGGAMLMLVPWLERWAAADFPLPALAWVAVLASGCAVLARTVDPAMAALAGSTIGMSLAVCFLWPPHLTVSGRAALATVVAGLLTMGVAVGGILAPLGAKSTIVLGTAMAASWVVSVGLYPRLVLAVAPSVGGRDER